MFRRRPLYRGTRRSTILEMEPAISSTLHVAFRPAAARRSAGALLAALVCGALTAPAAALDDPQSRSPSARTAASTELLIQANQRAADDAAYAVTAWEARPWDPNPWHPLFAGRPSTRDGAFADPEAAGLELEPDGAAPARGSSLRLSPAEALEVRIGAGLEPPRIRRDTIVGDAGAAASFGGSPLANAHIGQAGASTVIVTGVGMSGIAFSELPGGIVFGLATKWPDGIEPRAVEWRADGRVWIVAADGKAHRLAAARPCDLIACLEQARAAGVGDALVSITRSGRAQLSPPFAKAEAGASLARADLAPFAHLRPNSGGPAVLADKSVVVDQTARIVVLANGDLLPLVDLELRLYRSTESDGLFESSADEIATREPARAELVRALHFAGRAPQPGASAGPAAKLTLNFERQTPGWWQRPPVAAIEGLERDLAPAAHFAAWTALWRSLLERGAQGL